MGGGGGKRGIGERERIRHTDRWTSFQPERGVMGEEVGEVEGVERERGREDLLQKTE